MLASRSTRLASLMLLVAAIAACGVLEQELITEPGWRRLEFTVINDSVRPAKLVVAEDTTIVGRATGRVTPNPVPAGATVVVTVDVPPGETWGIFLNPGEPGGGGGLLTAHDVPANFSGSAPFTIEIHQNGDSFLSTSGDHPGWLGD